MKTKTTAAPPPPPPDAGSFGETTAPSVETGIFEFPDPVFETPVANEEPEALAPESQPEQDFQPFDLDPVPDLGPADDPLGLAKFANSEISSAKDGPLLFRLFVSGIDSKEMRESIREVLEDTRFGWDTDQIFAKLERGVLKIENLSPVKASILVTRIKRLPVRIRWEQYAISQTDSTR